MASIEKHIYFYQPHIDILDEIIDTQVGVSNYSEAVRFLCMTYDPESAKTANSSQAKLNAMGKEISILSILVAEMADAKIPDGDILVGKNAKSYKNAQRQVEEEIKRNRTLKYSPKKRKKELELNRRIKLFDVDSLDD